MDDLPHLEAAARISVITLIASVNELTNGIDSIKEEIDNMKNLQIKQQNDYFVKIMEVYFFIFFFFLCYISLLSLFFFNIPSNFLCRNL